MSKNYFMFDGKKVAMSDETAENLKKEFSATERRWRAEKHEEYFSECGGETNLNDESDWGDGYDSRSYAIGNYYKTQKEAQAVIDLKKYIYAMIDKYGMPEEGDRIRQLGEYGKFTSYVWEEKCLRQKMELYSGEIMHNKTNQAERIKMTKLLKAVYA